MLQTMELEPVWYAFLQLGVLATFGVTAVRAWRASRAQFVELVTAFLFGLLLEQGDIFLFGTYRYNPHWVLLGDVPVAIALTWAMIIAGAMNLSDALGIDGLAAPMADAVWAILLDLALDAVAIRLGLWTWTIRADQGWFGVPWGNFFAWLMVAFWFSFFTRWVRAQSRRQPAARAWQWGVPFAAFGGLIATLTPFVAVENTAALPFVPKNAPGAGGYHNEVWVGFGLALLLFGGVTVWGLARGSRTLRQEPDHWLLLVRLMIHGLFLAALFAGGWYLQAPLLLLAAAAMLAVELILTFPWLRAWGGARCGMRASLERDNGRTGASTQSVGHGL